MVATPAQQCPPFATLTLVAALLLTLFAPAASAMLHPQMGRFLQRDPVGYIDGLSVYEKTRSDPVSLTDPLGLFSNCSNRCLPEHHSKSERVVDFAWTNARQQAKPSTITGLASAAKISSFLHKVQGTGGGPGGSLGKGVFGKDGQATNAAINAARQLGILAMLQSGIKLWIQVEWDCCEYEWCFGIPCRRLNWDARDDWFECPVSQPNAFGGHPITINRSLALRECLVWARTQSFASCP